MNNNQKSINIGRSITLCHINIEGSSSEKSEFLSRLAIENRVSVIAVQETHIADGTDFHTRGRVPGFTTAAYLTSRVHGIATYIREDITDYIVQHVSQQHNVFRIVIEVFGIKVINIYKPPNQIWPQNVFHVESHPAVFMGDFNSHHTTWGYANNNQNGIDLYNWAELHNLFLVHDLKDLATFNSARWQRGYNPDLCFVTRDAHDRPMKAKRNVIKSFPRSQHRPIIMTIGTQVDLVNSFPKPRWNFQKANWAGFTARIESSIRFIPNEIDNYERFLGIIKGAAKKFIPRGYRKRYIPCWTAEMETLYQQFEEQNDDEISDHLLELLNAARKSKWETATQEMNFTHSSRKGWRILRHLGETSKPVKTKPNMDPEKIATVIVNNSKAIPANKHQNRIMKAKLRKVMKSLPEESEYDRPFVIQELQAAINDIKLGKAAGLDGLYPEFIHNLGSRAKYWILKFLNKILKFSKLPSLMKKTIIIAILKPNKPSNDPSNYRPIALLSIMYKLLERLIYNRIKIQLDSIILPEHAGFREKRSCTDQVLALTTHIETGFEKNLKTAMILVDLSSAYDTVWRIAFLWKFYKVIPSRKLGRLINSMLTNRRFRVFINEQSSRFRMLNNGFAQGSVCAPPYFNLYISDMPSTRSRKFGYADDLGLTIQVVRFEEAETILQHDIHLMKRYYVRWRLKLNDGKTEVAIFHLDNNSATRELNVYLDGERLTHNHTPTYLGLKLDRSLTYKPNLEKLAQKLQCRNNLIQKLAGSNWGANGDTLRTAVLSLVYSAAEYCATVWYNSCHVNKIDVQLNTAMRTITGAVASTPIEWLHVLSNIAPPELRRKMAAHKEWNKCFDDSRDYELPIRSELEHPPPHRLVSRSPIWLDVEIQGENYDINAAWESFWTGSPNFSHKHLIDIPHQKLNGFRLPRKEWKMLNRFRSGHGCSGKDMHRWNFRSSPFCDCDDTVIQSMDHILDECQLRRFAGGLQSLHIASPEGIDWLRNLDINI